MKKQHLKTMAAPASWQIKRKSKKWVTRPRGSHKAEESISMNSLLKDVLKFAKTTKEVRHILQYKGVFVNGIRIKDEKCSAGVMDLIEIPEINATYRILFNRRKKLFLFRTNEKTLPLKIVGKRAIGKKVQLNLFCGWNILIDDAKDYKVGDSVVFELPHKEIKGHLKLKKGSVCYLIGGKHVGEVGEITKVDVKRVFVKTKDGEFETSKEFVYIIGEEKPVIETIWNR